jgi:glycosyltransferase involved in cell wall biosynthesis
VDAFLPVSRYYGDLMRDRARLPDDRVHVVYPGIRLDGFGLGPATPDPPVLGYLARMYPGKGLETLVEAYLLLRKRDRIKDLKLRVAGSQTASDVAFVRRLQARIAEKGLTADTEFLPNVDRDQKIAFLQSLSVLSVPAVYGESFGLYVVEGLAAGVPFVQPRHAAFPEIHDLTGGGALYEPGSPEALAEQVEALLARPEEARLLGERGRQAVQERFSVERMGEEVLRILDAVTAGRAGREATPAPGGAA